MVDTGRCPYVFGVQDAEHIATNAASRQQAKRAHGLALAGPAGQATPVPVVELGRAIQAQPHREAVGGQKIRPGLVEQHAVRLEPVADRASGDRVLALEFNDAAKIVEPEDGGLAPMPLEVRGSARRGLQALGDVLLEQIVGHAAWPVGRKELLLGEVVAVFAPQVAARPSRLGHDQAIARHDRVRTGSGHMILLFVFPKTW